MTENESDSTSITSPEVCAVTGPVRVDCWDWNPSGATRGCLSEEAGSFYKNGQHGVYACGPAGSDANCEIYGKPSDGTIDVCGDADCSIDGKFYWSYVCYDGYCHSGGNYVTNDRWFTTVYSQIVHRTGGTFGGWADSVEDWTLDPF